MSFDPDAYLASKSAPAGGFDPDAYLEAKGEETPEPYRDPRAEIPGMARAAVRGFLDMVPGSHRFIAAVQGEPVEAVDQRYEAEKEASPWSFHGGQGAALFALPGPKGIKGMAALGAAQAAGDARGGFRQAAEGAGLGAALGGALGGAGKLLAKPVSAIAERALPWLQRLEAKYAGIVGDKAVREAEKTANSAFGSYRSSRGDANRILELLERRTGDPATDAASDAILKSPEGQRLMREVTVGAQDRAPEALANMDSLRALSDETRAAIPTARAEATTDESLKAVLAQRTKDQLGRYAIPAVTGAVGAAIGGPVGMGIGAAAGRGVSPGVRAVVLNNALAPERKLLMSRAGISTAQKLAGMASSQPEMLGKFAAPLAHAAGRGDDAVAATHFVLAQDPEYQQLMHDASEGQ